MDQRKARQLAVALMHKHGVGHIMFEWTRAKKALGHTKFLGETPIIIGLSTYWVERLSEPEVTDTILHEIAHAKAGRAAGHSFEWKRVAREVGAKPDRCARVNIPQDHLWTGQCPAGHGGLGMHRAPGRVRSCNKCSPGFNVDHLIAWSKNGVPVPHNQMPGKYALEYARIMLKYGR